MGTEKFNRDSIRAKERTEERTEESTKERTVLTGWYIPSCPSTHCKSIVMIEKSKIEEVDDNEKN